MNEALFDGSCYKAPRPDGYCFDTDALVNLIRRSGYFDESIFPDLRADFEELTDCGLIKCPEEVLEELKQVSPGAKQRDPVLAWALDHGGMFVPLDGDQARIVAEILARHPGASGYDTKSKPAHADVFVIALAELYQWPVVTSENRQGSDKIPTLCDERAVRSLDLLGFMREMGWRYARAGD